MSDSKPLFSSVSEVATRSASGLLVADGALGLIGSTPLVRLRKVAASAGLGQQVAVWAKAEFLNGGGSVKDRPALAMILEAERAGVLKEGSSIIEATSGNTGISLAMIAAIKGYRCVLVMPEDMSLERRYILRAYGAEIVLTSAQSGMAGAVKRAEELLKATEGAFMPSQFENQANPSAHEQSTALEILEQLGGEVAAFVAGVGTGGTVTGVGSVLKQKFGAEVRVVAVEPATSAVLSGKRPGMHGIQGLGAGFVPEVLNKQLLDQVVTVTDVAAERMVRRLAKEEGLLVGPSAGANVHAALEVAASLKAGNVVTVLCDSGERYLF